MDLISHRGFWKTAEEKNTIAAFARSFELGFGTETDIRDCAGQLVISHDMPNSSEMLFEQFLDMVDERNFPLALNIKSDGLAGAMRTIIDTKKIKDWFVFDMSIPDMRHHLSLKNPVFTRVSEIEPEPALYEEAAGIWLDAFYSVWYDQTIIEKWLLDGKRVCIVSPELHKRAHTDLWQMLKSTGLHIKEGIILCTDIPDQAKLYFNAI